MLGGGNPSWKCSQLLFPRTYNTIFSSGDVWCVSWDAHRRTGKCRIIRGSWGSLTWGKGFFLYYVWVLVADFLEYFFKMKTLRTGKWFQLAGSAQTDRQMVSELIDLVGLAKRLSPLHCDDCPRVSHTHTSESRLPRKYCLVCAAPSRVDHRETRAGKLNPSTKRTLETASHEDLKMPPCCVWYMRLSLDSGQQD